MFLPQGLRGTQEQQQSRRTVHDDIAVDVDDDRENVGLGNVTDMERGAPTRSIRLGISHSMEEGCADCPDRLEGNEIKVVDPHRSPTSDSMWMHLNCWEVENPRIVQLFVGVTNANASEVLRTFAAQIGAGLFQGWHELDCIQRKQVLYRVFYVHTQYTVTAKDILTLFGNCRSRCSLCRNPNWCSYHPIDCLQPELTPTACTNRECDGILHHMCQIDFQTKNNIEVQRQFVCLDCNPEAKAAYLASLQNNQRARPEFDRPIAPGNNVSLRQLQDSQRMQLGRQEQQLGRQEQQLARQEVVGTQGQQQVSTTRTEQQEEASSRPTRSQSNEQQRGRSSVRTRYQTRSLSNGAQRNTNQARGRSSSRGRNATRTSAPTFCKH